VPGSHVSGYFFVDLLLATVGAAVGRPVILHVALGLSLGVSCFLLVRMPRS
jgi:hypothetical protein